MHGTKSRVFLLGSAKRSLRSEPRLVHHYQRLSETIIRSQMP
jgi:hypothetical protein